MSSCNIQVVGNDKNDVFMVVYSGALKAPESVAKAMRFGQSLWVDPPALRRAIFAQLIKDLSAEKLGIRGELFVTDDYDVLVVDCTQQTVSVAAYDNPSQILASIDMATFSANPQALRWVRYPEPEEADAIIADALVQEQRLADATANSFAEETAHAIGQPIVVPNELIEAQSAPLNQVSVNAPKSLASMFGESTNPNVNPNKPDDGVTPGIDTLPESHPDAVAEELPPPGTSTASSGEDDGTKERNIF